MLDINLGELIEIVGEPTKVVGHQYYFRCPICSSSGGDTSGDNLLYNSKKGVLKCFACSDGGKQVLKMINNKRRDKGIDYSSIVKPVKKQYTPWWQLNLENLMIYMIQANQEITNKAIKYLWNKHGINKQTIRDCEIGYDSAPNMLNIGESVVFPMISINHDFSLVGFELRQIGDEKIIRHTYESPSCLCCVWNGQNSENLIIVEGFKDGYCLKQILEEQKKADLYTILTPANGAEDIFNNLSTINFTKYNNCYLLLDNDKTGNEITQEILNKYTFFIDKRDILDSYNDVGEFWMGEYVSA